MMVGSAPGRTAGSRPDSAALTLSDEHTLLLGQVSVRADDVVTAAAEGRWPRRELRALLDYLRAEVLRQATDEESLLFPARPAEPGVARLRWDHLKLRRAADALADAVDGGREWTVERLATTTSELLGLLERHLAAEDVLLDAVYAPRPAPATAALTGRRHEWYPLTEGAVVDLDLVPASQMVDATVERLTRLRPGEQVELRSSDDLCAVWRRLDRREPGAYGFVYLRQGPPEWAVRVTRRPAA